MSDKDVSADEVDAAAHSLHFDGYGFSDKLHDSHAGVDSVCWLEQMFALDIRRAVRRLGGGGHDDCCFI